MKLSEEQINHVARIMYGNIHILPYGFPSPFFMWEELPIIDEGHVLGTDKQRYIEATEAVIEYLEFLGKLK